MKVSYDNKVYLDELKDIPNKNKVTAEDMNEIKNAINSNSEEISKSTDEYSSSKTYSTGDLVIYNNKLYKASQDITTAEAFNSSHWTEVTLLSDVNEIKDVIDAKANSADVYTKNDFKNAGAHNSLYRGKDITSLFYDGTLSKQIAAGTFDDIFVGDYIIGKVSGRKYLVADLNYRLHTGDTECTTPHVLMIPERTMGTAKMNDSNITTGAYVGSKMHTEYLTPFKTVINNDFGAGHILKHRNIFANAVTNEYESSGSWYDSTIELMSEKMVYGTDIFHNIKNGTNISNNYVLDKSQLSIFKHRHDLIDAFNDSNQRQTWWLRDVASSADFCLVGSYGNAASIGASYSGGVRPAFLIY